LLKTLWTEVPNPENLLQSVIDVFFREGEDRNSTSLMKIGLKIMIAAIVNISSLSNYNNVFWFYRRTTYMFQKTGLPMVFMVVFTYMKRFLGVFLEENVSEEAMQVLRETPELLETLLKAFQTCMTYNYSLSYIDTELDNSLDYSVIVVRLCKA
jgi:hypothetical protein